MHIYIYENLYARRVTSLSAYAPVIIKKDFLVKIFFRQHPCSAKLSKIYREPSQRFCLKKRLQFIYYCECLLFQAIRL